MDEKKAAEYVGWALFNLHKGKYAAVETLLRKAYKELTGVSWDGQN